MIICFMFRFTRDSTAIGTALLIDQRSLAVLGYKIKQLAGTGISDRAAKKVQEELEVDDEVCEMHDGDKVGSSATGKLVRTRDKVPIDAFPAGRATVGAGLSGGCDLALNVPAHDPPAHKLAVHFSYSDRDLERRDAALLVPGAAHATKLLVDLNTTRISSEHRMLGSVVRERPSIEAYQSQQSIPCALSVDQFREIGDIEAVLNITQALTLFAQHEKNYTAALSPLAKSGTLRMLRMPYTSIIDQNARHLPGVLVRKEVPDSEMTLVGQECKRRALIAMERRFAGSEIEAPNPDAKIEFSDRQLLAMLFDPRTAGQKLLSPESIERAKVLYVQTYVHYGMTIWENRKTEVPAVASVAPSNSTFAFAIGIPDPTPSSGGLGFFDMADTEDGDDTAERVRLENEAKTSLNAYMTHCSQINWRPYIEKTEGTIDLIGDLLSVDVGSMVQQLKGTPAFGLIPKLALDSSFNIGTVNAESFCERVLSHANILVGDRNVRLNDEEIEMIVILRMNIKFMAWCRAQGWSE